MQRGRAPGRPDQPLAPLGCERADGRGKIESAAPKRRLRRQMQATPEQSSGSEEAAERDRLPTSRGIIAEWTVTVLLLLFATTTLVQAFVIPTGSMEDSLLIGDHVLVDKLAYAPSGAISQYLLPYQEVERGDIIVFRYPMDLEQTFVKRVVGMPGDRIRIVDKQLWINGRQVSEPYVEHKTDFVDSYRDNFPSTPTTLHISDRALRMLDEHVQDGDVVVPQGNYFALGDNRDQSLDSRYWGFVPRENIVGKPLMIYWSYDAPTRQLQRPGVTLEHLGDLALNFFSKTRWKRTFKLIRGYEWAGS